MAILPIVTYNDPILRKKCEPVEENSDQLQQLIDDMFETMYNSDGVGLAAPQVGKLIRLFVMDADHMGEEDDEIKFGPLTMINPVVLEKKGEKVPKDEGCLSIPAVSDKIYRPDTVVIEFFDRNFNKSMLEASGWPSRIIQHEYDHLDGILFLDYLSTFKKRMHKKALQEIDEGKVQVKYPVVPKI